ncbi:MAG: hypothetical protein WBE80_18260 [Methylocella sp.]
MIDLLILYTTAHEEIVRIEMLLVDKRKTNDSSQQIGDVRCGPPPMREARCRPAGLTLVALPIG